MARELKVAVIREELFALTGDAVEALVLNQMVFWSKAVNHADKFLEEEMKRSRTEEMNCELFHGWIYKTGEQLCEELMRIKSPATIARILNKLVKKGWLQERSNPNHKWDRTKQYRVDIIKLQRDLQELGYALEGYPLLIEPPESSNPQNEKWNNQNAESTVQDAESNEHSAEAIPETTSEITTQQQYAVVNSAYAKITGKQADLSPLVDKHGYERVMTALQYMKRYKKKITNPYGFLVDALSLNWDMTIPPDANLKRLQDTYVYIDTLTNTPRPEPEQVRDIIARLKKQLE